MDATRRFLESLALPDSAKRFPDGAQYRVEIPSTEGPAALAAILEEARVVRQVFTWVGHDRCSIGEVCRRLNAAREKTRTGKTVWDRATVWDMLKNPAYKGAAAFGKTSVEPLRPRLRGQRGRPMQPKRAVSTQDVPREKWMSIAVPALVDEAEFEPRITRMRERITQVEEQVRQIQDEAGMEHELRLILGRLETFASTVKEGLAEADWLTRRGLIPTLVKRVEVDQEHANVIFRIGPTTPSTPSDHHTQSLQHCGRRVDASLRKYCMCYTGRFLGNGWYWLGM